MATYPTSPALSQGTTSTEVNPTNWNTLIDNVNAIGADLVAGRSDGSSFPGTDHTASQATNIDGAMEAIRHVLSHVMKTNWYNDPMASGFDFTGDKMSISLGATAGDDFAIDTNKFVVEGDIGNIGVGTATPTVRVDMRYTDVTTYLSSFTGLPGAIGDSFSIWNKSNTDNALVPIYLQGRASGGAMAIIGGLVTAQNYTDLVFMTENNNTISEKMRILSNGNVLVGATAGTAQLYIDQSAADGAKPVVTLDQADVSEEFIKFIGTAANGVLTQSIVAAGDVGAATLQAYLEVNVQDDGSQISNQAYYIPIYTIS